MNPKVNQKALRNRTCIPFLVDGARITLGLQCVRLDL